LHLSRSTFSATVEQGMFRLPTTVHITYCGKNVLNSEVGVGKFVNCLDCLDAKTWEEIDKRNERQAFAAENKGEHP